MAVDRRALRRYPGRKRIGRRRTAQPPPWSWIKQLGLAVSSAELLSAEHLQKTFEYDQSEFLRAFVADRRVRIQAVQAIFVLMGVNRLDPIKKLVWAFLDQTLVWQVLLDSGWADCDADVQEALNDAEINGQGTCDLRFRAWVHQYSLPDMRQVNLTTGRFRELRRTSPWSAPAPARWQFETKFGWSDCNLETHAGLWRAVCEAEREGKTQVQVDMHGSVYELDLVRLIQKNVSTGRMRALRFGPPQTAYQSVADSG